jgi:PAS domain S-box-containing protein
MIFPRLTLKTRVTILFPLAITIAVGSLLFLLHALLQHYIKESISRQQYQILSLLAADSDRSSSARQQEMVIIAGNAPLAEAYAPANQLKMVFLAILPLISLSTFWLTRRYLHRFTAPIVQLTDHVKSLSSKTGVERIFPVQGGEEVAILGAAFNALIREIDWQQSELASRETLYRTVVDSSLEMIFWISADRQIMHYISPSCQNVTGYACADFYRQPDLLNQLIHPLDLTLWQSHCRLAGTQEFTLPLEFRIVTAAGETRWTSHLCRPVYNEEDECIGVRGSFLDITLWKEAEAALFASEEKFRLFFEEASDAIFIIDRQGIILVANDEACLRYGFSHGEMIGRPMAEFDATAESDFMTKRIAEVMSKGAATFESKHRRKGAAPLPVEINARSILFEEKKVVLAVARDISERKRNVAHLRKLSVAVEQNPASIVITDTNGIIEYVNPHFTTLTGYTLDELVGKTPSILKSDETSSEAYGELWQTILTGGEWRGEFHNRKKNGELYWGRGADCADPR